MSRHSNQNESAVVGISVNLPAVCSLTIAARLAQDEIHWSPAPKIQTVVDSANFPVISLESPVIMKLMSNRDRDRTHLRDLIGVGLVDSTWVPKLPTQLAARLQQILDTPDA